MRPGSARFAFSKNWRQIVARNAAMFRAEGSWYSEALQLFGFLFQAPAMETYFALSCPQNTSVMQNLTLQTL